jgi:hypothetical protein
VGTASGLEPINLQIPRRTRVMAISFLVHGAAVLWIAGLASSDGLRASLIGLAVLFTVYAVVAVVEAAKREDDGGSPLAIGGRVRIDSEVCREDNKQDE